MIFNAALGHTDGWGEDVGVWRVLGYSIVKKTIVRGQSFCFAFAFVLWN